MTTLLDGWGAKGFSGLDLGDKRLNKRAIKLVEQFADKPTVSIPVAAGGWADTIAAYRFLDNEDGGGERILDPRQLFQQMIEPQGRTFATRWQVAVFASSRITISHRDDGDLRRIIEPGG